jgi:hypothetical protein
LEDAVKDETVLEKVEIVDIAKQEREDKLSERDLFWKLCGAQQAHTDHCVLSTLMWAENLHRLQQSKAYRAIGLTWEQAVERFTPFSWRTAQRLADAFSEFGRRYFEVKSLVRISAQAYREVNPQFTDSGEIIIGSEKYPLKKEYAANIQAAFEAQKRRVSEALAEAASAKRKAERKAEEAKKLEEENAALKRKCEDLEHPKLYEHADRDYQHILLAMERHKEAIIRLADLRARKLSPDNVGRLLGAAAFIAMQAAKFCSDIRAQFGTGYTAPEPGDIAAIRELGAGARDVMQEYFEAFPLKRREEKDVQ